MTLPRDVELFPQMVQLAEKCGGQEKAIVLTMRLWQSLCWEAVELMQPGLMSRERFEYFVKLNPGGEHCDGTWLTKRGDDLYYCRWFAHYNLDINERVASDQRIREVEAQYWAAWRSANDFSRREFEYINATWPSGISAEEKNRVIVFVRACDSILARPTRKHHEFSDALLEGAWRIIGQYKDWQVQSLLRVIHSARLLTVKRHEIPVTAEEIARDWHKLYQLLTPAVGWVAYYEGHRP